MKLTIIPDVHGRPFWRDAMKDVADTPVVFLGDYLDPYPQDMVTWDDALQGLHDIIELKKRNPEQVALLLGNHDVHYFESYPFFSRGGRMSHERFDEIRGIFMENLDLFDLAKCICCDKGLPYLFTHAGFEANVRYIERNHPDMYWYARKCEKITFQTTEIVVILSRIKADDFMAPSFVLILLVGYFAVLMGVSLMQKAKVAGNDSFFSGNRRSPWYVVSFGMIGASLSGVTFVSVPGMVRGNDMLYMQTVLGFFVGYVIIAEVLLPVYFKLDSPSIYSYLKQRFGQNAYKTGSSFFLLSKLIGAAARLYVVVLILQVFILDSWNVPFWLTATFILLMIWLYTRRGGIKTIVWTDMFQTFCLLGAVILLIVQTCRALHLDAGGAVTTICHDPHFHWFEFADWQSKQHFVKQFFSGIFIALAMTGLDQDMMQKNLSISRLKDAKRNIYAYGAAFLPVNFLFLCLGVLLLILAAENGIALPAAGDDILPMFATQEYLGQVACILFVIGIIAASFSSADSALTALTTSFCVDLLEKPADETLRRRVHIGMSLAMLALVLVLKAVNSTSLLDAIYTIAGYTYGPLLGMFAFGLITRRPVNDRLVPIIAVASPLLCAGIQWLSTRYLHYTLGYELLILNGIISFIALRFSKFN